MASDKHHHVRAYLDYYRGLSCPGYAVLLDGPWGAGKSWLIQDYIETRGEDEFLYVSLFGARSAQEIAERIFVARYPLLTAKGVVIAGKILKGLVKISFGVDLDGDGKVDASVRSEAPDLEGVARGTTRLGGRTLVLDDVERAEVHGKELWGMVNQLVEHEGASVVLLAHESEISDLEDYRRTKEKAIGRTLSVKPDAAAAFEAFVGEAGEGAAAVLRRNKQHVLDAFAASEASSLRVLRFAVRDVIRVFSGLDDDLLSNGSIEAPLLMTTLAIGFEVYTGKIRPEDIGRLAVASFFRGGDAGEGVASLTEIVRKYSGLVRLGSPCPSLDWWGRFFAVGHLDEPELARSLRERYVDIERKPAWLRLANFDKLSDAEFERLLDQTWNELLADEYRSVGAILHTASMQIWAGAEGLAEKPRRAEDVRDEACRRIEHLEDHELMAEGPERVCRAHAGVVYAADGHRVFQDVVDRFHSIHRDAVNAVLRFEAHSLVGRLREGGRAFYCALGADPAADGQLDRVALREDVLAHVAVDDFVEALLERSVADLDLVFSALHARLGAARATERDWVKRMVAAVAAVPAGRSLHRFMLNLQLERLAGGDA